MILGYEKFKVLGDNYSRFYREIYNGNIPCNNMYEEKEVLYFEISVEYSKEVIEVIKKLGFEYEIIHKKGIFFKALKILRHKGLVFGGIVSTVLCVVLNNFVFQFKILCDDVAVQKAIIAVLDENNVKAGSYIPNINLVKIERELKQKVEQISWAGISVNGSTLTIDIVENIPEPESRRVRLPCNLISKFNGVVDKIELFDGQLMTTVGSGVSKGDILVSGTVVNENITYKDGKEIKDTKTKYVRSYGHIYGDFEQTVTINQPFEETKQVVSDDTIKRRYFKFFDLNIPMFLSMPDGSYISEEECNELNLFGNEIPLGIKTLKLNEYSYKTKKITKDEAIKLAKVNLKKYEKNHFKDYEIKDVKVKEEITKNGVKLTGNYKLYGEMAEESEFFVKK